jgi:8-oxo-dGTP pyrophosphatase MutT (NUDIX family)
MIERLKPEHMKRTADLLQQKPRVTRLLVSLLRLTRARFTSGVIGVILNDRQQVLLVKHVFHPDYPWGFPGGWIERRESPRAALRRELEEELGIVDVEIGMPLAVETGSLFPTHLDVAFLCKTAATVTHISRELLEYRWMPLLEMPRLSPFHQLARDAAAALAPYEVKEV